MASLTEGQHPGEFILSESPGSRSREAVTVLSGQNLKAGHVVGSRLVAPTIAAAAADAGNAGDGAFGAPALATNLGAQRGNYRVVIVEPAANAGTFQVFDPDGRLVGVGVVAVEFDNQIKFTIADGATDFVSGDNWTIAVTAGTVKVKEYDPTDADGGQRVYGVLYDNVDASASDLDGVAVARDAEVRSDDLQWFSGASAAQKAIATNELADLGIIARS